MKISIVIPMFNAEKYVERCLKSIKIELIKSNKVEVILVNDGSTDNTKNICEKMIDEYQTNNIKLYNKENAGVSSARNFGMTVATGDYIMFVDIDDYLKDNWFKIISESINDEKKDVYYFSNQIEEINKDKMISYIIGNNNEHIILAGVFSKLFKRNFIIQNEILFKEDIINGEDMLFNLEVLTKTDNFQIIKKSFYQYRIYVGSSTKRFDEKIIDSDRIFQNTLYSILSTANIDDKIKEKMISYCLYNGILTIIDRISFIEGYNKAKEKFAFLKEEPYYIINKEIDKENKYSLKKNIIFFLIRHKYYHLIYFIFRLDIKKTKMKKEYYISI